MPIANRYILTSDGNFYLVPSDIELCHHGVKGQKWGVRRYQNADGSLTLAGKKRLNKLTEKLDDSRLRARVGYDIASKSASAARTAETRKDRNTAKYVGIRQMDGAYNLDKKISKLEKRIKDMGVNPKKDSELIAARTKAGKEYVKRSGGEIAADYIGQVAVNAGSVFAQVMLGSPLLFAYYTTPNKHKLRSN